MSVKNEVIKIYPEGHSLLIGRYDSEYLSCCGEFFMMGDTNRPTHIDLTEIVNDRKISLISIRSPSIVNIWSKDVEMCVEYFKSVIITNDKLIIEV